MIDPNDAAFPWMTSEGMIGGFGLSKRELFAGLAMACMCAAPEPFFTRSKKPTEWDHGMICKGAVQMADALLAALNAEPKP